MNKKAIIILIILFVLILGTVGFLLYQRSNSQKTETEGATTTETTSDSESEDVNSEDTETPITETENTNNQTTNTPQVASKLFNDPVISPYFPPGANILSYINATGNLILGNLVPSGNGTVLYSNPKSYTLNLKPNPARILWGPDGTGFIAEYVEAGKKSWVYFNVTNQSLTDLPKQITAVDWLPDGKKIAYIWLDKNNKSTLFTATPDNVKYEKIADIWENDDDIKVSPDGKSILYYRTTNTKSPNPIVLVSSDGKIFKTIIKDGFNFGVSWSPDGSKFIFGRKEEATGSYQLWSGDIVGGEVKSLGIYSTTDKILWDKGGQVVYIAGSETANSVGQDKLFRIALGTVDKTVFDIGFSADMGDMSLGPEGKSVLFKNRTDGFFYVFPFTAAQ